MAQHVREFRPASSAPQTVEQSRAWEHVERVFGRRPISIGCVAAGGSPADVCLVKVQWILEEAFEFISAGGVLVGVPFKSR